MKPLLTRADLQGLSSDELVKLVLYLQQHLVLPDFAAEELAEWPNGRRAAEEGLDPQAAVAVLPGATGGDVGADDCQRALDSQVRRAALLTQIAIELNAALDAPAAVERVLRVTARTLELPNVSIILINPQYGGVELARTFQDGGVQPMSGDLAAAVMRYGLGGWVLRHNQSVVLPDVSRDRRWIVLGPGQDDGSALVMPIKQQHTILGVLTVFSQQQQAFTSHDLLLLEGVGAQLSVALSAASRRQSEALRREQALTLLSTSQFLTAERSLEDVAAMVQAKSTSIFGARYGLLFMRTDERPLELVVPPADLAADGQAADGQAADGQAGLLRRAGDAARAAYDQNWIVKTTAQATDGLPGLVGLPLAHNGHAIGAVVLVGQAESDFAFSASTWSLLTVFTNFLAATCTNMQLVARMRGYTETLEALVAERTGQLQHSRDTLRSLFDNVPNGLLLLDADERLLAANQGFCQPLIGQHPRTIIGLPYAEVWQDLVQRLGLQRLDGLPDDPPQSRRVGVGDGTSQARQYIVVRQAVTDTQGAVVQYIEGWYNATEQVGTLRAVLL